jgi:hypothetical protein
MPARPILRGDLFTILDPDPGPGQLTPGRVGRGARRLLRRVEKGERSAGAPPLMALLADIAAVRDDADPVESWRRLSHVRANLKSLALGSGSGLSATLVSERSLVIPQTHVAEVSRVVPAGGGRDVWFVLTREVTSAPTEALLDDYTFPDPDERELDAPLGPPLLLPFEATWRLFRFGERAFDIRAIMRIAQPARGYDRVHVASDGQRVAVVTTDKVGIFDAEGQTVASSQLPFGRRAGEEALVAGIALDGDTLAMNLRQRPDAPFELALIDMRTRRGFPVGHTGASPASLTLGPRQAYLTDDDTIVRLGLFGESTASEPVSLDLSPWFAEYGPLGRILTAYGGEALWVSNGQKLLDIDADKMEVRAEYTLAEPIVDLHASGQELWLVHHDRDVARIRLGIWERDA